MLRTLTLEHDDTPLASQQIVEVVYPKNLSTLTSDTDHHLCADSQKPPPIRTFKWYIKMVEKRAGIPLFLYFLDKKSNISCNWAAKLCDLCLSVQGLTVGCFYRKYSPHRHTCCGLSSTLAAEASWGLEDE